MLSTNPLGDKLGIFHTDTYDKNVQVCTASDLSRSGFNLKSDKTLENNCENIPAYNNACITNQSDKYNLSPEKHDRNTRRLTTCKMDSHWWNDADVWCTEDEECILPEGNKGTSDYYAKLLNGMTTLSVSPCNNNYFSNRMKNPDTVDLDYPAWSDVNKICNDNGIDPYNEKCKRYDQMVSCERRTWKEDCEQQESGCSMYEGGSCCTWLDDESKCVKNSQGCNRHSTFAECNADSSRACRWGPDLVKHIEYIDNRSPGCYINKGWEDSYLNTQNNTCRSPYFYNKNMLWQRTGGVDSSGALVCQLVTPPKNVENLEKYFQTKEECEGKMKPPPKFACLSIDKDDNFIPGNTCTEIPESMHWTGATYSTKEACEVGTNYCTTIKDCRVLCTDEQCEEDHCPQSHMFPYLCTTGPEKSGCNSHVHGWEESSQCHGCCDSSVCV